MYLFKWQLSSAAAQICAKTEKGVFDIEAKALSALLKVLH